jgi:hypothetical protein
MLMLMVSPDGLIQNAVPSPDLIKLLIDTAALGNPVGVISNHPAPPWFASAFVGTKVQFVRWPGRQKGLVVSANAGHFHLKPYDTIVLAAKDEDVQMGKNGGAVLIAAGWSHAKQVISLGIRVSSAAEFNQILEITAGWSGHWWYSGDAPQYSVRALADLSTIKQSNAQVLFGNKLKGTVKSGGPTLNALLAIVTRSLLMDGLGGDSKLLWGVYPSSSSSNDDTEILSDFAHRLRTTVSRVRFAERPHPLFLRHHPAIKRSTASNVVRTDPSNQIQTICLNPLYKDRIKGRHVIVVDDCTTYGVSFGVAAAFLRKAGAAKISGVALGKFGNQLRYYEIEIKTDPFKFVTTSGFTLNSSEFFPGSASAMAQQALQLLIP